MLIYTGVLSLNRKRWDAKRERGIEIVPIRCWVLGIGTGGIRSQLIVFLNHKPRSTNKFYLITIYHFFGV